MKNSIIIKEIRSCIGLSQNELAKKERMIADGRLTLPQGKVPLCIFGVKK